MKLLPTMFMLLLSGLLVTACSDVQYPTQKTKVTNGRIVTDEYKDAVQV